jgi:hypothetical protein
MISYCSGSKSYFNWLITIAVYTAYGCAMLRPSIENNKAAQEIGPEEPYKGKTGWLGFF